VAGPDPSRLLGRSLGIQLIPLKGCKDSCVQCLLARTLHFRNTCEDFFGEREIVGKLERALRLGKGDVDYVTFLGESRPTLHGQLCREALLLALPTDVYHLLKQDLR